MRYQAVMRTNDADAGAALALRHLHEMLGFKLEPTKHQPPAFTNVFLGVTVDTSHVSQITPYVEFRPSPDRTSRIMGMLNDARPSEDQPQGFLDAATACTIRGKLTWILQSAWGAVGRAALQPLRSRCSGKAYKLPGGGFHRLRVPRGLLLWVS